MNLPKLLPTVAARILYDFGFFFIRGTCNIETPTVVVSRNRIERWSCWCCRGFHKYALAVLFKAKQVSAPAAADWRQSFVSRNIAGCIAIVRKLQNIKGTLR